MVDVKWHEVTNLQAEKEFRDFQNVRVYGVVSTDKTYYAKPGSFYVFDPRVPHRADNILCDEKRIAIDYTVRAI